MAPLTCRELVEFLSPYLERALPDPVRRQFDAHLAVCPECTAYVRTYTETVKLAHAAFRDADASVPAEVPEELVKAVLAARRKR